MATVKFDTARITGVAAAVPQRVIDNLGAMWSFPDDYVRSVVAKTGIRERRWASDSMCSSDLCFNAATRLLNDMDVPTNSLDALIFVSQTPDYRMPMTAAILQSRLGLNSNAAAFDISIGCSGFVYGLMLAFSLVNSNGFRRILLLNGETRTKAYSFEDRATGLLFGDAGAATLVERAQTPSHSVFHLNTDGSGADLIMAKSGGYRNPTTLDSLTSLVRPDGGSRADEHGAMDGAGVFAMVIDQVPTNVRLALEAAGVTEAQIDFFVFHQANRFMNEHLRRKIGIPEGKYPYSLQCFGNTSGVSIPLTMATQIRHELSGGENRLVLTGFGVGMSWGTAVVETDSIAVSDLCEITERDL